MSDGKAGSTFPDIAPAATKPEIRLRIAGEGAELISMRRFLTLFVLLPIALVVVVLSVANRGSVTFSLNPIGGPASGWAVSAPLYVFLFLAVIVGIVIGGIATWAGQGRWRHAARAERANADRLRADIERFRARIEAATPSLAGPRSDRNAA